MRSVGAGGGGISRGRGGAGGAVHAVSRTDEGDKVLIGPPGATFVGASAARADKVVLQFALTRLARHYGLIGTEARHECPDRGLRHWGSEDYRPTLDAWSGDQ